MKNVRFATVTFFALVAFALWPLGVRAWDSIGYYTHEKLTDDALFETGDDYPDLSMFANQLKEGSKTEAHNAPGDGRPYKVWAPDYKLWWDKVDTNEQEKGALPRYMEYDFTEAYKRLGFLLHLLQDEKVPAHRRKCPHGYYWNWTDDFEAYADGPDHWGYWDGNTAWTFVDLQNDPWYYWLSDPMDDDDEDPDNLPDDSENNGGTIIDGPGSDPNPASENWGVGSASWGTYGWGRYEFSVDPLPGKNKGKDAFALFPNEAIAKEQLKEAYVATLNELKARSEEFPPLVPDDNAHVEPSLSRTIFGPNMPVDILFSIMENRMPTVLVSILADGLAIADTAGRVWDGGAGAAYVLTLHWELPWEDTISRQWKGDLAGGELNDGVHTIGMQVRDQDGHDSELRTRTIKYDKTKPIAAISVTIGP